MVFILLGYTVTGDSPAFRCTVHKDQLVLQRDYHRTAVGVIGLRVLRCFGSAAYCFHFGGATSHQAGQYHQ